MIIISIILISTVTVYISGTCPSLCDQKSCTFGLLLCSESGLNVIPEIPSQGITNVIIMNQRFPRPILTYRNLSRYGPEEINLKIMTLHNCGLTDIESESFSHLIHLTNLDLSKNELKLIRPRSFKALNLKVLKLDENPNLELTKDSLKGLVVNFLSLANCGIRELQFDTIREISGHLTKLYLSGNKLKTLSFRFFLLFRRLEELKIDKNNLKCDCHLKWLVGILTKLPILQTSNDTPATCFSPPELSGKLISSLPESQFECLIPTLKKITVNIMAPRSARLSCLASTQSEAHVFWLRRNNQNQTKDLITSVDNATVQVHGSAYFDQYSCYAVNDNGNVTVDLNIHWPPSSVNITKKTPYLIDKFINMSEDYPNKNVQYLFLRQFSLLEMLLSIASTFVITIVLFSLIYFFLARKIRFVKDSNSLTRSGYDGGLYSDIPVYDVPHVPSPLRLYPSSPTSQLLDFKTQRLIPSNQR